MSEGESLRCILRSDLFLSLHIMLACANGVIFKPLDQSTAY